MKRSILAVISCLAVFLFVSPSFASVSLNVDAAPNAYGSPNWGPWWAATQTDVANGTFTNMRSTPYAGTTNFDAYDEIVYSTGDLGKRLTFTYWIPNQTVQSLTGNFEIKLAMGWDGAQYALDWNSSGWLDDGPNVGWVAPKNWENYNGGVIGSIGLAFWAMGSDGNPAHVTQADIDGWASSLSAYQTSAIGEVRIRESADSSWQETTLQANMVPEPSTIIIWSLLGGLGLVFAWRKRKAA
jgi:hypothetical protein